MAEAENLEESAAPEEEARPETPTNIVDTPEPDNSPPQTWPDDWRDLLAGNDEKFAQRLARFTSPENLAKSWKEAQKKISQGFQAPALSDEPDDDELATYREQVGIPGSWEDYSTDIEGLVFGEDDKPVIDGFLEFAHSRHVPQQYVTPALEWYHQFQEDQAASRAAADQEEQTQNIVALKEEWGPDYRQNLNAIRGMLDGVDENLFDLFFSARTAEGGLLGNNATAIRALAQIARQANPAALVAPGTTSSSLQSVGDEIKKIERLMRENPKEYFADEDIQKRLRDLYEAQGNLTS